MSNCPGQDCPCWDCQIEMTHLLANNKTSVTHDELLAKLNQTTGSINERLMWGNGWHKALIAVVELHKPEMRYYVIESWESSWGSVQDVIDHYCDDEITPEMVKSFAACGECSRLGIIQADLSELEYSYKSSSHPCPTIQAITRELS